MTTIGIWSENSISFLSLVASNIWIQCHWEHLRRVEQDEDENMKQARTWNVSTWSIANALRRQTLFHSIRLSSTWEWCSSMTRSQYDQIRVRYNRTASQPSNYSHRTMTENVFFNLVHEYLRLLFPLFFIALMATLMLKEVSIVKNSLTISCCMMARRNRLFIRCSLNNDHQTRMNEKTLNNRIYLPMCQQWNMRRTCLRLQSIVEHIVQ
jgi:hypothetical protein